MVLGDATGSTGECSNCHSPFASHLSHTPTVHAVSMGTDQSNGSSCNTSGCHGTFTDAWGGAGGIYDLHTSDCTLCHDSARNDADGNVQTVIQGGAATCLDCHATRSAEHANPHTANNFTFDSNCQDCHGAGTGTEQVVSEIHGDTCTTCHSGTPATRDNEMLGAAANGIDGDATQADGTAAGGTWGTVTCTTCHNPATYTWEAIHTDTATAVDHSATVTNADTTCNGCHDASAGGTAPDAIKTPFVGSGEVHNNNTGAYSGTCANCHTATGTLQAAPARAASLSATGGNCSACHDDTGVNYFASHTHDHTLSLSVSTGCDSCHNSTLTDGSAARNATNATAPWTGTDMVHVDLQCDTCHDSAAGGAPKGSATNWGASWAARASGECTTCHIQSWTNIHDGAAGVTHTGRVDFYTACVNCHVASNPDSNARIATNEPYIGTGEVHAEPAVEPVIPVINGALRSSGLTKADQVVANGPSVCYDCHLDTTTWDQLHANSTALRHDENRVDMSCRVSDMP